MNKKNETDKFDQISEKYHKFYKGKISSGIKVPIEKMDDFSIWYTPGVAEPCRKISEDGSTSFKYTNRANRVAVISDGTRVLGLGNIGAEAGLPVMEGKSLLFKYLGGVDAYPLCIDAESSTEISDLAKRISPTFGGINLEDIESPKCFEVLENLRKDLDIPVWHDDQQGTALVSLAGLMGATKLVGKKLKDLRVTVVGAGAAGLNIAKYVIKAGVKESNVTMVDSKGILSPSRDDLEKSSRKFKWAKRTNPESIAGDMKEALAGSDACIAASAPGPGVIKREDAAGMAEDAILFATANPTPEITPAEAKKAGVKIVGTGRSDFPNQINNSLGFPAVFRGALDVGATDITDEMCISAAQAISERAEEKGLSEESIIPSMDDMEMYVQTSLRVAETAKDEGAARRSLSKKKLEKKIRRKLTRPKQINQALRESGLISRPPK
ncbi:MAG: NAD(P)-dependent malic enzyme [Candidatus Hadarchaeota archaeon]